MIETKYCYMHKKHNLYEGYFKYNNLRIKVKAYIERDWDGLEYIITEIYKFRKGRYEFIRSNGWSHHDQNMNDAVSYIVDKVIERKLL